MPIRIPNSLPAAKVLHGENIFIMDENRAAIQDIRPLQIALVNLMPTKIVTETQLSRLLSNTPLQVELELVQMTSRESKNTSKEHMLKFYKTFNDIKDKYYDGLIITGAPVEHLAFEEVEYWEELKEIMEWSKSHVYSTFHICWGAQAALYYHYGIEKTPLDEKMFGVFNHKVLQKNSMLLRGFDDPFKAPHSRHTTIRVEDVLKVKGIKILATSEEAGLYALATEGGRQIFVTGHSEYDAETLKAEYDRDKALGKNIKVPVNYYPDDDDSKEPIMSWRAHANLLYSNWLNYFVYQETPFIIEKIKEL